MSGLRVEHPRHYGRWIASIIAVGILALILFDILGNPRFYWDVVLEYVFSERIVNGFLVTIALTVASMTTGILLGIVLALLQVSKVPLLAALANLYIWFFRGTPLLVQVIFWYNIAALYPEITIGIPHAVTFVTLDANQIITPIMAGLLALSLNEGAYMAEIVRAGLIAVDEGQREAADSIGMSKARAIRRIILPQAMRIIIPPTGNQAIGMLKTTSLVSVVAVPELLYTAQNIAATNYKTIPLLIAASLWYIAATTLLSIVQYVIESHYSKGAGPKSGQKLGRLILDNLTTWKGRQQNPQGTTPNQGKVAEGATQS